MRQDQLNKLPDKKLVKLAKQDYRAFAVLYERYFDKIYGYIFSLSQNHTTTEDVVSNTFEKALLNIGDYKERGFSFGAWLHTIARNALFDTFKKENRLTQIDDDGVILVEPNSSETVSENKIEKEELWAAIDKLNLVEREVVILRYIEDYNIKEVAKMTDRSVDSVKSTAKRALKKLKLQMQ